MRNINNVKCFLLPLYFLGIGFAIDTTSENMPHEIESRLINSGGSDSLLSKSEFVQLLKDLEDQGTYRQQLALARSGEATAPSFFDYIDMVWWTMTAIVAEKLHKPTNTCYENVGCFDRKDNMSLPYGGPMSPKEVGTLFFLFYQCLSYGERIEQHNLEAG